MSKKRDWEYEHFGVTEDFVRTIRLLYNKAIRETVRVSGTVKSDPSKPFTFDQFPAIQKQVNKVLASFSDDMVKVINSGTEKEWLFSAEKNDALVRSVLPDVNLSKEALNRYMDRNIEALTVFQKRKFDGLGLSDRVWNQTQQFKQELEMALDVGLSEGKSANSLSADVRSYLNEPEKLFRRVRDKRGVLQLSKAAKAYHPGQGVYRSSFKNAQRLTRTEINMAYRESDFERWGQLDFVVGYEVRRSNNLFGCDVCGSLVGKYPKTFKFRGWHPNCRCHCVSILASKSEIELMSEKMLNGESLSGFKSTNEVSAMPGEYNAWIDKNHERLLRAKSLPYFIRDNYKDGKFASGLKFMKSTGKSGEKKKAIQASWDERKAELNKATSIGNRLIKQSAIYVELSASDLRAAISAKNLQNIKSEIGKLSKVVRVAAAEERKISALFPNLQSLKVDFSMSDIRNLYASVSANLDKWKSLSLADQFKKLDFEIGYVLKNQKYSTWKQAAKAYQGRYFEVKDLITIEDNLSYLKDYLVYGKSPIIAAQYADLLAMQKSGASTSSVLSLSNVAKLKAEKLIAAIAKRATIAAQKKNGSLVINTGLYSPSEKASALRFTDTAATDRHLRPELSRVWLDSTEAERKALYDYTESSGKFNRPLRGYDGSWHNFKGVGQVPFDNEATKGFSGNPMINAPFEAANAIAKNVHKESMWLHRGSDQRSLNSLFGINIDDYLSGKKSTDDLVGRKAVDEGFISSTPIKGKGFSGDIMYEIFAPKGTEMMYLEPISHYGVLRETGYEWDGLKPQSTFNYEFEMLVNRGYELQIISVQRKNNQEAVVTMQILKRDKHKIN